MKKSILLATLIGAAGLTATAQSPVKLDSKFMGIVDNEIEVPTKTYTQGKREVTAWYNFIEAASVSNGGPIQFTYYSNNPIFPDSTVLQTYGTEGGGNVLNSVARHNVGQMFDPKSFLFKNDLLSIYNAYIVDSFEFGYRYSHNIPGSVDTLEFQVFYGTSVRVGNLVDQNGNVIEPTAWIEYDRVNGKGANANEEWRITLDETDTSWAQFNIVRNALPTAATIPGNGLIAIAYRFIPGYEYNVGDTLSVVWDDPVPTKLLNEFQPFIGTDNVDTREDSYNNGLTVRKFNKYDPDNNWASAFIPGDAWNDMKEYVYIGFHISSPNVSVNTIDDSKIEVYPNPSMGQNVNIAFNTEENANIAVEVYDMLGNKVQTVLNGNFEAGQQVAEVNTANLKSGIYVYSIKAGEQTIKGKFSVVK